MTGVLLQDGFWGNINTRCTIYGTTHDQTQGYKVSPTQLIIGVAVRLRGSIEGNGRVSDFGRHRKRTSTVRIINMDGGSLPQKQLPPYQGDNPSHRSVLKTILGDLNMSRYDYRITLADAVIQPIHR